MPCGQDVLRRSRLKIRPQGVHFKLVLLTSSGGSERDYRHNHKNLMVDLGSAHPGRFPDSLSPHSYR